jgi:hypothetical protein
LIKWQQLKTRNKVFLAIILLVVVGLLGFIVWAETPLGPMPEALEALKSDSLVNVSAGGWLVFRPISASGDIGFIVYPGGRVDYRSYAPIAHAIAAKGYPVIIVQMPLNLAVLGIYSAQSVIDSNSEIKTWAIGGHSLGGSMAAQFISTNPAKVKGLILWAAYPASGIDLSKLDISAITVHGTNDGLVTSSQIDASLKQLPLGTTRIEIVGGNHAQFGWYGPQQGDKEAQISRDEQQKQIVDAAVKLLESLK